MYVGGGGEESTTHLLELRLDGGVGGDGGESGGSHGESGRAGGLESE